MAASLPRKREIAAAIALVMPKRAVAAILADGSGQGIALGSALVEEVELDIDAAGFADCALQVGATGDDAVPDLDGLPQAVPSAWPL